MWNTNNVLKIDIKCIGKRTIYTDIQRYRKQVADKSEGVDRQTK